MPTPLSFHDERPDGHHGQEHRYSDERGYQPPKRGGGSGSAMVPLIIVAVCALLGLIFSMTSTSDFIEHLDRQVHSIHCSLVPGARAEVGENGCRTVMMSPYSSLFRTMMWGGIPIALLSVATFAFLLMRSLVLAFSKATTKKETLFMVAATGLPALMSIIYGSIAATKIGAACTMCIGIYVVSTIAFISSIVAHMMAPPSDGSPSMGLWARHFGEGCVYVFTMVFFYVIFAPTSPKSAEGCGTLVSPDDPAEVFITMSNGKGPPALAVLDPLCPACKGFDERIVASGIDQKVALKTVLFPLDQTCNWMVKESVHPGACAVSEAMLCDKDGALDILDWAFEHQERLRATAKTDEAAVRTEIEKTFPKVKGCLGSSAIKNKVNKSLRFAVANALPLLTPQLFIGDKRICDEDTDLGLEFSVDRILAGQSASAPSSSRRRR